LTEGKKGMGRITKAQITPIKPKGGLVTFASFVLDNCLYLGSVGVATRLQGGYRLIYPTKQIGNKDINVFHPINKPFAEIIENEVMNDTNDRYHSINA